jgi:thiol-disulfide isomerase/thioredoxin
MFIRPSRFFLIFPFLIIASALFAREPEVVRGQVKAPALRLPDLNGKPIDLRDFKGEVVLINFWATWCPPCREEMPSLWKLQNTFRGKPFRVVAVNMAESKSEVNAFLPQEMKRDFVVLMDREGSVLQGWKVPVFPTTYIIDKRGRIRYHLAGPAEWDSFDNKKLVEKLLAEPDRVR